MGEIEAKSEIVREQGREYGRVQAAHEQIAASLAIAQSENRQYTTRINQLEAEARRDANNRRCTLPSIFSVSRGLLDFKPGKNVINILAGASMCACAHNYCWSAGC